jgi:hypothetical protein
MDDDVNTYAAFLHSLPPDRVLPSLRQDLVSPDEKQRRAAVAFLRQSIVFLECFGIPEHLANVLIGPHAEAHQPALASLLDLGWRGAMALRLASYTAGNERSRARLVEALRQVSQTLDPATRRTVLGPMLGEVLEQGSAGPAASLA